MRTVKRGASYYRVVAPGWQDPSDTSYSKQAGGRYNPPGEFGALYLNANLHVAAANARSRHAGRAIKLFDLLPEARPELVTFDIPPQTVADLCTPLGIAESGFAPNFPYGVPWPPCHQFARTAHASGLTGIAALSHAEVREDSAVGEELALFDSLILLAGTRQTFAEWYPDPIPG